MRKLIAIITIVCFAVMTMPLPAGEEASQDSSEGTSEGIGEAILIVLGVIIVVGAMSLGFTTTTAAHKKSSSAAVIFHEAIGSQGERPNLEILAGLYETPVDDVIDTISEMAANGEIDIEKALTDPAAGETAMYRLGQKLENQARNQKGASLTLLQKFREKAGAHFDNLMSAVFPSLEIAKLYRSVL